MANVTRRLGTLSGVFTQQGLPGALRRVSSTIALVCYVCGRDERRALSLGRAIEWRLAHADECPGDQAGREGR